MSRHSKDAVVDVKGDCSFLSGIDKDSNLNHRSVVGPLVWAHLLYIFHLVFTCPDGIDANWGQPF